ncbi:lipopolysaccharide biosynthesis protein [Mesotoga sp. BH458_6_3_2_1]|uniref:lipopolysaccharide biosynthesis protein n=1 Tax=Mesotoga sp. BH458_6_3_2_1 TaxID=1437446 RepID=UPI000EF17F11|nr:lipopolysaccharide biosynthesis protein [Mesotoga sp. BH458_6_3_2_1]RLL85904.1 lipopolysaccharide biosynthesis protein [Mesotoga sp. BH458_6_3_2_1]
MNESSNLRQKAASGLFWSFSDLIANQGIQFIIQVILARMLLPEDFGLIGMITIFISLSTTFIDSGFSQALIREQDAKQEDFSTVFYFNLAMASALYLVLFLSAPVISDFFREPKLIQILRVLSLVLIINSFGIIQRVMLVRRIDFKTQTKISIVASVVSGAVAVALAYFGLGVWSLVIRTLTMQFLVALLLSISNKWKPSLVFSMTSFKKLFRFGSRLLASGLLNTIYVNIYYVIIGRFFSATELGYFTNGKKLEEVASHAVSTSLQRVSYPVLSSIQKDEHRLRNGFSKIIRTSTFINFPLMVFLAAIADPLISLIFGEKWLLSIPYFQILCFAGMLFPLHAINLNILQVKGRSDLFLKLEIIKKASTTAIIVIVLLLRLGIIGLLWGSVLSSYISYYINAVYSKKLISYSIKDQVKDILPSYILSFVMGALVLIVGLLMPGGDLVKLIVQVFVGFLTYVGLSKLFKIGELGIVRELLLSFLKKTKY